jgi:hypothetical protein
MLGMGCAGTPEQTSADDHGIAPEPAPERPPTIRLLAGAQPDGALIYESWVTDGQLRTSEPEAVPDNLEVVSWRAGEPLTFEVGSGQVPVFADVLVYDRLPADRVPDTQPERIRCEPSEWDTLCRVDQRTDGSLSLTVRASVPSEIIILNLGWLRPATDQDPDLPPQVSASWAFAVEASP